MDEKTREIQSFQVRIIRRVPLAKFARTIFFQFFFLNGRIGFSKTESHVLKIFPYFSLGTYQRFFGRATHFSKIFPKRIFLKFTSKF